jgi:hypothetical protein
MHRFAVDRHYQDTSAISDTQVGGPDDTQNNNANDADDEGSQPGERSQMDDSTEEG